MGPSGRLTIGPRPSDEERKPYRILDGNQEAPTGFGFYVGKRTTTYEVVRRGPQGVRRFSLGNVTDIGLEEAYAAAREKLAVLRETGDNPAHHEALKTKRTRLKAVTVADCLQVYLDDLQKRVVSKKAKPASLRALGDSLNRLARPEVGAGRQAAPADHR